MPDAETRRCQDDTGLRPDGTGVGRGNRQETSRASAMVAGALHVGIGLVLGNTDPDAPEQHRGSGGWATVIYRPNLSSRTSFPQASQQAPHWMHSGWSMHPGSRSSDTGKLIGHTLSHPPHETHPSGLVVTFN